MVGTSVPSERLFSKAAQVVNQQRNRLKVAWHRPQSDIARVEEELMEKSARALESATDPLERLRLMCLSRGACGVMELVRVFRTMFKGKQQINKKEFYKALKESGLEINTDEAEKLFELFDTEHRGSISLDEFFTKIRPPMAECRRAIVQQAFRKLDKAGHGVIPVADLRALYSVNAHPRYMSGEETADEVLDRFLLNFQVAGTVDGHIKLEEFVDYYNGISVSMDNDGFFDLILRQTYKL